VTDAADAGDVVGFVAGQGGVVAPLVWCHVVLLVAFGGVDAALVGAGHDPPPPPVARLVRQHRSHRHRPQLLDDAPGRRFDRIDGVCYIGESGPVQTPADHELSTCEEDYNNQISLFRAPDSRAIAT
jgi:hypothetical protein